jgi:hypothetical protein
MEELDFDPDRFIIVNPVWFVANRESIDNPDERGIGVATGEASGGRVYVAAFTDQDLAGRFATRMGDPDALLVPVPTPPALLTLLEYLAKNGHEHIAIDPELGQRLRIATLASLIQVVRNSLKRQDEA